MTDKDQIKYLTEKNEALSKKVDLLIKALDESIEEIYKLDTINQELKSRIETLERLIHYQAFQKDSQNSNLPPSSDINPPKKNKSIRTKSGKKKGGQKGHTPSHLKKTDNPDEFVQLKLDNCQYCGTDLTSVDHRIVSERQEIFLPPVQPKYRAFQQFKCTCPNCNKKQKADFPEHINAPIQYGKDILAINAYLNVYQFIPYDRSQRLFKDLFNLDISQATLANLIKKFDLKAKDAYKHIKDFIAKSDIVGSDETSAKVNGHRQWIWTFQNPMATYIFPHQSRGFKAVIEHFPDQFPNAIYVSDQLPAQLKVKARLHQHCWAHLLRYLKWTGETENQYWANQIKDLFYRADFLKKNFGQLQENDDRALQIQRNLNKLLIYKLDPKHKESQKLQRNLSKNRWALFTFLYHKKVPPDNNGSERAIRNIKVKLKVSGQFLSGQHAYCRIRSIIDTCIKNGQNIIDNLANIATNQQLLFKLT